MIKWSTIQIPCPTSKSLASWDTSSLCSQYQFTCIRNISPKNYSYHFVKIGHSTIILNGHIEPIFCIHIPKHNQHIYFTCFHQICPRNKFVHHMEHICHIFMGIYGTCTGGSHLRQVFWEHENLSSLSIIWLIQLL